MAAPPNTPCIGNENQYPREQVIMTAHPVNIKNKTRHVIDVPDMLDNIPFPMIILDVETLQVIYTNSTAHDNEINTGATCHQLLFGRNEACQTDSFHCPLKHILQNGQPMAIEIESTTGEVADRRILLCIPITGADGRVTHLLEMKTPPPTLFTGDQQSPLTTELLWEIINHIPNMVFVKEAEKLSFVFMNRVGEALLGIPEKDLLGKNDFDLFPQEQAEFFTSRDRETLASKHIITEVLEEPIHTKHRGRRLLATRKVPILDNNERPKYLLGISEDVTEIREAERQLKESQQQFQELFNNVVEGIGLVDNDENIEFCNPAFARIMEEPSPEAICGKSIYDYVPKSNHEKIRSETGKRQRGEPSQYELEIITAQGNTRHIWLSGSPRFDNDGSYIGAFGTFFDITERKLIEQALRESNEKFRIISEAANDGIIVIDSNGKITFWNKAAQDIFGYSLEDALGQDVHTLLTPHELTAKAQENLKKFGENGQGPVVGQTLELKGRKSDGTLFPIEISVSAIHSQEEWIAIGIIRDISRRKREEERIQQLVNQYTAMINTVPAALYLKDTSLRYVEANDAFCSFIGRERLEVLGATDDELFEPDRAGKRRQSDTTVLNDNETIYSDDEKQLDYNGDVRWVSEIRAPLRDKSGRPEGVVGITQDITEQHLGRTKMLQNDKLAAIGTLAAGVAHEINNPMGFISSNLNTMKKYLGIMTAFCEEHGPKTGVDLTEMHEIMEDFGDAIEESLDGAARVKKIVADLKSFSRVDRAEKEFANINEGLESTLNIVWNELKYKCEVVKDLGDLPDICCLPNQLNQVFMNLLVNAGHAIDKSGTITIRTWADDENIHILIKDTGCGIPERAKDKIFEPFFTTKEVGKGTGLGLSLSHDIIRKHNGQISFESTVGVGTEFIIELPIEGLHGQET